METHDIYWAMDACEAMDVWQDMHDFDCRPPIADGDKGTEFVR